MLESLLAGQALTLHVNPLLVWGPAALLALVAVMLILWPRQGRVRKVVSSSVVMRSEATGGGGRIIVGLLVAGFAVLLATVLREPQVTLAAESMTCRSWPRPIAWSEVASLRTERIGFTNRPVVRLVPTATVTPERRGPLTQVADRLVGMVRGPSRIGANGAICGLDNLTVAHDQTAQLASIAWGRARFGPLPDPANAQALAAWCERNPGPRCTREALSADLAACARAGAGTLREQACRYERIAAPAQATPRATPSARPPAPPAPATPPAQPAPPAQPQATPAQPRPATPAPPVQRPAQPAPQPPAAAPAAKPPAPAVPAGKPAQ